MDLVIVESPNKVKTIQQFLGKDYKVEASIGHISKIADTGLYNLGINVNGNFELDMILDERKKEVVKKLKGLVEKVDNIFIATDPD